MLDITYKLEPQITIGTDTVNRVGRICTALGGRALVISEQVLYENKVIDRVLSTLEYAGVEAIVFDEVPSQATADIAETAAELARGARCSAIVALGGLKTQAVARLTAILGSGRDDLFELLDSGEPSGGFIPYIAIPTTGRDPFLFSEQFIAVDPRDRSVKMVSVPKGLCHSAIIDQALSESLSDKFSATTAFDGFCVAVEAYCSAKANFLADAYLEKAIEHYVWIMDAYGDERNYDLVGRATNAGMLTALGASLSAPGIGTALAYALNGRFPVAKSWCSTVLLPYVMERYLSIRPERIARVAELMGEPIEGVATGPAAAMAVDGIRRRMGILKLPARLKDFSLVLDRLVPIAENAKSLGFLTYSPFPVSVEDAYDILKQAF
jgi:alcohol dehydrogenase